MNYDKDWKGKSPKSDLRRHMLNIFDYICYTETKMVSMDKWILADKSISTDMSGVQTSEILSPMSPVVLGFQVHMES